MKNVFEVFDDFEAAETKKEKMAVISKNLSQTLVDVLQLTFHPNCEWLVSEMPDNYKVPQDILPGITSNSLSGQIRKLYLFKKGEPTAESLTPEKRNQLLLQILESLDPRDAEVIIGIFRKDQGVKGLTYKFVKEAFPNLLP